jgi:hypothetical protein
MCAREVPNGSIVDPSAGRITLSNGSVLAITKFTCSMTSVVLCSSSCTGHVAEGDLTMSGSSYFTNYQDEWTSPPAPSSGTFGTGSNAQFVSLYDGLQQTCFLCTDIFQPVLVYGCITSSDCSNSWRLSPYAISGGAIYYVSPPLSPSQGNTIQGTITMGDFVSCSGGSGSGPGYSIVAQIVSGSSENLSVCTNDQLQNAVTGSIEVHNLSSCTQMPGTTSDSFSSISWSGSSGVTELNRGSDISGGFCNGSATWNNSDPNNIFLTLSWTDA